MVQGLSGVEIAARIGYTVVQVSRIRRRFAAEGMAVALASRAGTLIVWVGEAVLVAVAVAVLVGVAEDVAVG